MAPAPEPATSRAEVIGIKGGRAGAASRAIVMEPVHLVPPGCCQLGMTGSAPANERELDGLYLVHSRVFHSSIASSIVCAVAWLSTGQ